MNCRDSTCGSVLIVPVFAAVTLAVGCNHDQSEIQHFNTRSTLVAVSAPEGVSVTLLQSGDGIDDLRNVSEHAEGERWLEPGRWVLQASEGGRTWYYPVTTSRYRGGPDDDGRLIVSVRRPTDESPAEFFGMRFVTVPSGWFLCGDRRNPQEPRYVWLTTYFMLEGEVTNRAYRAFLASPSGWGNDSNWTPEGIEWRRRTSTRSSAALSPDHREYARFGQEDLPVTNVTWYEATAFASWAKEVFGAGLWDIALPDESEWEKSARGPDDCEYGLSQSISDREAEWYNWRKNPGAQFTVVSCSDPAHSYRPNRYGLFHMAGNVTEWTSSISTPTGRPSSRHEDSRDLNTTPAQRIARGGSWYSASVALLNVTYRETFPPEHSTHELGFRLRARRVPRLVRPHDPSHLGG